MVDKERLAKCIKSYFRVNHKGEKNEKEVKRQQAKVSTIFIAILRMKSNEVDNQRYKYRSSELNPTYLQLCMTLITAAYAVTFDIMLHSK